MKIYGLSHWSVYDLDRCVPLYDLLVDVSSCAASHEFGFAWKHRGLWCGLRRKFRSDSKPAWFAAAPQAAMLPHLHARVFESGTDGPIFNERICDIYKKFPGYLARRVLERVSSGASGFDGIPFAVHKIEDRNVRRTAVQAFQQNQ